MVKYIPPQLNTADKVEDIKCSSMMVISNGSVRMIYDYLTVCEYFRFSAVIDVLKLNHNRHYFIAFQTEILESVVIIDLMGKQQGLHRLTILMEVQYQKKLTAESAFPTSQVLVY